jgi:hypothetical protein
MSLVQHEQNFENISVRNMHLIFKSLDFDALNVLTFTTAGEMTLSNLCATEYTVRDDTQQL